MCFLVLHVKKDSSTIPRIPVKNKASCKWKNKNRITKSFFFRFAQLKVSSFTDFSIRKQCLCRNDKHFVIRIFFFALTVYRCTLYNMHNQTNISGRLFCFSRIFGASSTWHLLRVQQPRQSILLYFLRKSRISFTLSTAHFFLNYG